MGVTQFTFQRIAHDAGAGATGAVHRIHHVFTGLRRVGAGQTRIHRGRRRRRLCTFMQLFLHRTHGLENQRPGRPVGGEAMGMRALYGVIEKRFGRRRKR